MRDISIKTDDVDSLEAGDFNALNTELENLVTSADMSLDLAGGPDVNLNMLSEAASAYSNAGSTYQDSGAANAYVLGLSSNLKAPNKYYKWMTVSFIAGNINTGASTVNVNSLGVKNVKRLDGTDLVANDILADSFVTLTYDDSAGYFRFSNNFANKIEDIISSKIQAEAGTDNSVLMTPLRSQQQTDYERYSFFVGMTSSQAVTTSTAVTTVELDNLTPSANESWYEENGLGSGGFDIVNFYFEAPVDGYYQIAWTCRVNQVHLTETQFRLQWDIGAGFVDLWGHLQIDSEADASSDLDEQASASGSSMVKLSAGHKILLAVDNSDGTYGITRVGTSMSGFLYRRF